MKRGSSNLAKLQQQKGAFAGDLHYKQVAEVAKNSIKEKQRKGRIDILVKRGIRKGSKIKLHDGLVATVLSIDIDGMIMLDNWDKIDPLDLEEADS